MAARCLRLAVCAAAVVVLAGACSGSRVGQGDAPFGGGASDADAGSGLAVLDETIPPEDIHGGYWPTYGDLRSISCASDVTFVGRITGYIEGLVIVPPDAEDPDPAGVSDVFDGVVFTVDDLLVGDVGDAVEVTVAFRAFTVNSDGSSRSRVTGAPLGVIRPGIEQRDDPDGPRYLVYALASEEDSGLHLVGVLWFNTSGGVTEVLEDGSLATGADKPFWRGHRLGLADAQQAAQAAERLCVKPPLAPGTWEVWMNLTGLSLYAGEAVWADRLDRVCKTALGADIDSPVWDQQAALALAEEFAVADGLRPDLPPQSRQQFLDAAAGALWIMVVQRAGPEGPSVCWDRAPIEFVATGPPTRGGWNMPDGYSHMTDEALALAGEWWDKMLWWVEPPLRPRTREIWWEATGLRATIDEDVWAARLNRACNTPVEDPLWDRSTAAALAEEFILQDGGEPSPQLLDAATEALWRMTTEPLHGACPWHYPPDTFGPEFFEQMKQQRQAALR